MNFMRHRGVRVVAGIAVVAATVGGLSACSGRAGAAVIINGQSISVSQVNRFVDDLNKSPLVSGNTVTSTEMVDLIILGAVANKTMTSFAGVLSDEKVCSALENKPSAAATTSANGTSNDVSPSPTPTVDLSAPVCDPWLITAVRASDLFSVLSSAAQNGEMSATDVTKFNKELGADIAKADIQVNGRYGVFSAKSLNLAPTFGFPWVEGTPAAAPTAAS